MNYSELQELVKVVNSRSGRDVACVISNTDQRFSDVDGIIPYQEHIHEVDWNRAVASSGCRNPMDESPTEKRDRISRDFVTFVRFSGLQCNDRVSFLSDDYFTQGIECEAEYGLEILGTWLSFPHAIFIVANKLNALHYIGFARSSYVFLKS